MSENRESFRQFIQANAGNLPPTAPPPSPLPYPPQAAIGAPLYYPQALGTPTGAQAAPSALLPDFKNAASITQERISLPGLLIEGLLHRGCKMVLAGGSKSFKSWSLIDLGLAVSAGSDWWGMKCNPGRVLYINFELIDGFFEQRLLMMAKSRGMNLPAGFLYWGLRGKCYDLMELAKVLQARTQHIGQIDLLIVDPIYKALGDLDENSAGDMGKLMRSVEQLSDSIGAAVVFGAHFSKGSQSGKESIDRISGSGVFARDPDAILTMTRHKDAGSYAVESELRYLPSMPNFVVTWDFPRMKIDEGRDPRDLWEPGATPNSDKPEVQSVFTDNDVLNLLTHQGLQDPAWRTLVVRQFGKAGKPFYESKNRLLESGVVAKRGQLYYRTDLTLQG